jgi:nucleoside permease NupC
MIEASLVFGLVIFAGILLILAKLPRHMSLRLLHHHTLVDIGVTALALWIHWGTMTGLMAAAVAGMCCSLATSGARHLFGWIDGDGLYHRGWFSVYP